MTDKILTATITLTNADIDALQRAIDDYGSDPHPNDMAHIERLHKLLERICMASLGSPTNKFF